MLVPCVMTPRVCPVPSTPSATQALQHTWISGSTPALPGTGRPRGGIGPGAPQAAASEADDLRGVQAMLFDLAWAGKVSTAISIRDKEPLLQQGRHTPFVFLVAVGELSVFRDGFDESGNTMCALTSERGSA